VGNRDATIAITAPRVLLSRRMRKTLANC